MLLHSMCEHRKPTNYEQGRFSSGKHPLKAIMIFVTEQCNLRCDYCYISKTPARMSLSTAKKSVDFLLTNAGPRSESVDVCFFGGEPLLEPELIRKTCEYARKVGAGNRIRVGFSITTNGTLLDEKRQRLLLEYDIDTTISLDGTEEIHDRHRKTANGSGSFKLIKPHVRRFLEIPKTTIRLTVTPETVHKLDSSVSYLLQLGFQKVNVAPVFEADWGEKSLLAYYDAWDRIYSFHDDLINKGSITQRIGNIDKLHRKLRSPGYKDYGCGAARNMVAVDTNGYLYPCHRYVGYFRNDQNKQLGDVFKGFDLKRRKYYISCNYTDNHEGCGNGLFDSMIDARDSRCSSCSLAWSCGGACMAINEYVNGSPTRPPPIYRIMSQVHVSIHMHYKCRDALGHPIESTKEKEEVSHG